MTSHISWIGRTLFTAVLAASLVGCAGQREGGKTSAADIAPAPQPATTRAAAHAAPPLVLGHDTVVTADVQYAKASEKSAPFQRLNVYAPRSGKDLPIVLFVHGGGWTRGDRALVGSQPKLFNDAGIVLVSVDYRLSPAVQHPAHADDVAAAVAWTKANIARHGGDPKKIFVMGHSAGAHVAAFVAIDPRPLAKVGMKPADLKGAIMLDGSAFDIPDRIARGSDNLAENCRRAFGPDPAAQADGSPVNHIAAGKGIPPFLLIYVKEGTLNHAQSKTMTDKLNAAKVPATLMHVDGKTHAALVADFGTTNNDTAGPAIVTFVRKESWK
jgi:acetyl esterase/lipase